MDSWQIYHYAKETLPAKIVQHIFSRTTKCIECWTGKKNDGTQKKCGTPREDIDYRWAANPTSCGSIEKNPIDRLRDMLSELKKAGRGDVARAAIDILSEPLGGHFQFNENVSNDKDVAGEAADTMEALGSLVGKIRESLADGKLDKNEKGEVREMICRLKSEIDQLFSAACEEKQRK